MSFFRSPRRQEPAIYGGDTFARVRCVVRVAGQVHSLAYQHPVHHASTNPCRDLPLDRLRLAIDSGTLRRRLASRSFPIFVGYRGHDRHRTGTEFLGPFKAARRFLSALVHPSKKPSGCLSNAFRLFVLSWFVPAHVEQQTMEADEACSKNQTMRFTA